MAATERPRGWWGWLTGQQQGRPTEEQYEALLAEAAKEDWSDLDGMGFLQVCGMDRSSRRVVLVSAKLYNPKLVDSARTLRYVAHKLHSVVQEPYTCVWLHTQATWWQNCPSAVWLWRTYESLPDTYRLNLVQLHMVHCDLSLWGCTSLLLPWWSGHLYNKVNWVSRVEFLMDSMDKASILPYLPQYVLLHDSDLEDQPLKDYGIVAPEGVGMEVPGSTQPL